MWLDRFERTKGDLVIMKVDEFRDKTISQIAAVSFIISFISLLNDIGCDIVKDQ